MAAGVHGAAAADSAAAVSVVAEEGASAAAAHPEDGDYIESLWYRLIN